MLQKCQLPFGLIVCFLLIQPLTGFAVEGFKVSQYGDGEQIWFEAEAFDERDSEDVYKLGKAEGALEPTEGAFGDIVTNVGGQGWLLYRFDISAAGGSAGDWRFITHVINPSTTRIGCGFSATMAMKFRQQHPPFCVRITSSLKKTFLNGHGCGPAILETMVARSTHYKTAKTS